MSLTLKENKSCEVISRLALGDNHLVGPGLLSHLDLVPLALTSLGPFGNHRQLDEVQVLQIPWPQGLGFAWGLKRLERDAWATNQGQLCQHNPDAMLWALVHSWGVPSRAQPSQSSQASSSGVLQCIWNGPLWNRL